MLSCTNCVQTTLTLVPELGLPYLSANFEFRGWEEESPGAEFPC